MTEKIDRIKQWIEKADHDLGTAIIIHKHIPEYFDTIAFHCQQAVEKYLKSYLLFLDLEIRKTHDLVFLINIIGEKEKFSEDLYSKASNLSDYGIELRYPDKIIKMSDDDIIDAIQIAKDFRALILSKMNLKIDNLFTNE